MNSLRPHSGRRHRGSGLALLLSSWLLVFVALALFQPPMATASATTFTYDALTFTRVHTHVIDTVGVASLQPTGVQQGPASPVKSARGTSTALAAPVVATESVPGVIYREGTPRLGNLTPQAVDDGMLSFRDSLSNPWVPPAERPSVGGRCSGQMSPTSESTHPSCRPAR